VLLRKKLAVVLAATLMLGLSSGPAALAAPNPSDTGTGPPNQECEEQPSSPPGFKTGGFDNAEHHYNEGSQYDVACYQVSHKGGSG
jgi:hypothetical protein